MDKNAIKKFAVWARTELIARVSLKGVEYGITEDNIVDAAADSINGKVLTDAEKKQRQALIAEINDKGYKQVMEEVAYTWFNRFSALRFMEVNGYLPSHVRVFTDEENNFKPQIITEAIYLELDSLDMEKVYELKEAEKTEELYKYLLIVQCNALNKILPGMFQKISDYTELLLPDNLLRDGSVIQQMIELIPEDDWKDAVQIIGWLYQYYNSEKKDDVFAALKKNVKITKENIPAATQLFTPDWIVRYMVENSLGRLWLEGHPDAKNQLLPTEEEQSAYVAGNRDPEDTKWHYYLEEAEQEPEVQAQLAEIRKEYAALTPDQLKVIDPCSGSGHILAYMFDVLMKIYESYGYTTREAVASIVENNIYGLDIDDRAAQLAYFAVMMKARQYDRRFFSRGIQPHVYAIVESNHVDKFAVEYFCNGNAKLKAVMDTIISELHEAKEYGSILTVTQQDWSALYDRFAEITEDIHMSRDVTLAELLPLVQVAEALAQKYDVVVTNPPYMSGSGMGAKLSEFVKKNYPDSKSDLFAVFIERCSEMLNETCFQSMITQQAWMFLSGYEKVRKKLIKMDCINMIHLGAHAFEEIGGEVVQTTSFVMRKSSILSKGTFCRLIEPTSQQGKQEMFLLYKHQYNVTTERFAAIPGYRYVYWIKAERIFDQDVISDRFVSGGRNKTHNNELYVRTWWEINADFNHWKHYDNGGTSRKWYGNCLDVVNWSESAKDFYAKHGGLLKDDVCEQAGISWNGISGKNYSFKIKQKGFAFSSSSPTIIGTSFREIACVLGLLNSNEAPYLLNAINPTLQLNVGETLMFPVDYNKIFSDEIFKLSDQNIRLAKEDWDFFETSWNFQRHPLLQYASYTPQKVAQEEENGYLVMNGITDAYRHWEQACNEHFNQLKANEEELNRIFINIYGLEDELTPGVEDKDVTVRKADRGRDIRSFISYAVGCMFGRYSLSEEGLIYAGGDWNEKFGSYNGTYGEIGQYTHEELKNFKNGDLGKRFCYLRSENKKALFCYKVDYDNIIPICDDEFFDDDIVGLFIEFVRTVYGTGTLDKNLKFIADALGGKGQPKDVIRNYFLNDFYTDHCKIYQKRPIYWLFDSGKKNGFKALIYMHRYQPDTIARIRTDYVHEQQARYRTAIADLEQRIANASTSERVKLNKKLIALQAQDAEIRTYEEKIHHLADQMISIDLDDGVKKNYAIFQDILAKIK